MSLEAKSSFGGEGIYSNQGCTKNGTERIFIDFFGTERFGTERIIFRNGTERFQSERIIFRNGTERNRMERNGLFFGPERNGTERISEIGWAGLCCARWSVDACAG